MTTTLQIRIDAKMKKEANKVLQSMGLDMSSGVKLFLAQVVNTKKIPFPVMSADFWPKKKKTMLRDIKKKKKKSRMAQQKHIVLFKKPTLIFSANNLI